VKIEDGESVVGAHGCDELLDIARDHSGRLKLFFSLFLDVIDDIFRMQSVPHDNRPQMLLLLQFLSYTDHFHSC
jgi:hypothetical protein